MNQHDKTLLEHVKLQMAIKSHIKIFATVC